MANRDIVSGFTPVGLLTGGDYFARFREIEFASGDSVAAFIGDMVKLTGTVSADGKRPVVAQCAATDRGVGVLVSLAPDFANESFSDIYRLASTLRKGFVCMGYDVLYEIQEDSEGNSIEITEAGLNASIIVAAGDTVTGVSGMEINSDTAATSNALELRLHHVSRRNGNALGNQAVWVVSLNDHVDLDLTGA